MGGKYGHGYTGATHITKDFVLFLLMDRKYVPILLMVIYLRYQCYMSIVATIVCINSAVRKRLCVTSIH